MPEEKLSDILARVDIREQPEPTLSDLIANLEELLIQQRQEQGRAIDNIMHKINSIATQLR